MRFITPEKNLLYASNLWYLSEGLFGPLFAVYSQEVGGNILDVTWAWATFMVVTGFATIIVGKVALTARRQQWLAVIGYAMYTLLTFAYIFVDSPLQLMIVQAFLGVAQALATPTWYALYAQVGTKAGGEGWGNVQGQASIITGLAFIVGGLIASYVSFSALFALMGIVQFFATIMMVGVLRVELGETDSEQDVGFAAEPA